MRGVTSEGAGSGDGGGSVVAPVIVGTRRPGLVGGPIGHVVVWQPSVGCDTDGMTQGALHLTAAITHEGEWYVSRCLQVEVTSQGRTIEAAMANLREALELYFEDESVPEFSDVITASIEVRVA